MRSALAAIAVAALAAASVAPARAYVRTTSSTTKIPLSWTVPVIPYHVNVDRPYSSPSCKAGPAGDPALEAIRASFSTWRQPCADIDLVYAGALDETRIGAGGTSENLVVFRQGPCSARTDIPADDPCHRDADCGNVYGCLDADANVVALTSVLYEPTTGRIVDADIEVNAWDGTPGTIGGKTVPSHGWYFTCEKEPGWQECTSYGDGDCWSMDLQNTITHEVGHFLGLDHNPAVPDSTMDPNTSTGEISKRTLSPDDVAGVCAIYPQPTGCASGGSDAGALAAVVALIALAGARRRP